MKSLDQRFDELEALARKMGLDPFPIFFEMVPRETIWDVASYGLPTRMSHWSFGRSYIHQKTYGEMGFSKVYELIINNNPSYAFLDDTNPDVVNLLVAAHCYLPGTYIQTTCGIKAIEDVKKDDVVWNADGETTVVKHPTSRSFVGSIIQIQAGSYAFSQTNDHRLLVLKTTPTLRKKSKSWAKALADTTLCPTWRPAEEIQPGDFLVVNKPKNIGLGLLNFITIPITKTLHRQSIKAQLMIEMDEDFGRLVGLYLAEGYARPKGQMGLCFHSDEKELHKDSSLLIKKYLGLSASQETIKESHSTQVLFNEICIAQFLRESLGSKCDNKHLPEGWMKVCSKEFLKGVLRGFLEGDGDKKAFRSMGFSTTSGLLAMQIQKIAMRLGIFFGIDVVDKSTPEQPRRMAFIGHASGIHDSRVRQLLGMPERKLERTWSGCIDAKDCFYIKVNNVTKKQYSGEVRCLNVESGESFTLANGIVTHNCYAHADFFKNNSCFFPTNRNMVNMAEQNARLIDDLKSKFGLEVVEEWMDAAFALDRHIDPKLGEFRQKYPEQQHVFKVRKPLPFADLFGEDTKPLVTQEIKNTEFPPFKERDILWFLTNYAQMLPGQREIFSMIRSESFYFYPQFLTKIMNEGWASFWHAELMLNYDGLTAGEYLDFAKAHSGVVSAGPKGSFNPYYIGFKVFGDIKRRWDEYHEAGKKDAAFQRMDKTDFYDEKGKVALSKLTGYEKILRVRAEDDDVGFIRNYLTRDLAEDLELFTYGYKHAAQDPDEDDIILRDRDLQVVVNTMTDKLHNYGAPLIWIEKIESDQSMVMRHAEDELPLDQPYAKETLKYVYKAWKKPVTLHTHDRFKKPVTYVCDEKAINVSTGDGSNAVHMNI